MLFTITKTLQVAVQNQKANGIMLKRCVLFLALLVLVCTPQTATAQKIDGKFLREEEKSKRKMHSTKIWNIKMIEDCTLNTEKKLVSLRGYTFS